MAEGFGRRIRGLRKAERWTQEDLAARSGLDQATISQIEVGRVQPTMATVTRLAGAFGLPVEDLARQAGHLPMTPADQPPADIPDLADVIARIERRPELAAKLARIKRTQTADTYERVVQALAEAWQSNAGMMLTTWETALALGDDRDEDAPPT